MNRRNLLPEMVFGLVAGAILLPVVVTVIWAVSAVLAGMGDTLGGAVLARVALAFGILWVIDLVGLVIVQGLAMIRDDDQPPES